MAGHAQGVREPGQTRDQPVHAPIVPVPEPGTAPLRRAGAVRATGAGAGVVIRVGPGSVPDVRAAARDQGGDMTNDVLNEATTKFRQLRRSRQDRMVAGVCGGAAQALGVDAALLRLLLVAATLLGFGAGAVLYLVAWALVPDETP